MKIIVHAKLEGECPYCERVKAFLSGLKLPFEEIVHATQAERDKLYDGFGLSRGSRTVPQVVLQYRDGREVRIGGFAETLRARVLTLYRQDAEPSGAA